MIPHSPSFNALIDAATEAKAGDFDLNGSAQPLSPTLTGAAGPVRRKVTDVTTPASNSRPSKRVKTAPGQFGRMRDDYPDDDDEGDADIDISFRKGKDGRRPTGGGGGSSCHQCRSRRNYGDLTYCTSSLFKKNKINKVSPSSICRKKYCEHCLKKFYKEVPLPSSSTQPWKCPSCRRICCCAACRRRESRDVPGPSPPRSGTGSQKKSTPGGGEWSGNSTPTRAEDSPAPTPLENREKRERREGYSPRLQPVQPKDVPPMSSSHSPRLSPRQAPQAPSSHPGPSPRLAAVPPTSAPPPLPFPMPSPHLSSQLQRSPHMSPQRGPLVSAMSPPISPRMSPTISPKMSPLATPIPGMKLSNHKAIGMSVGRSPLTTPRDRPISFSSPPTFSLSSSSVFSVNGPASGDVHDSILSLANAAASVAAGSNATGTAAKGNGVSGSGSNTSSSAAAESTSSAAEDDKDGEDGVIPPLPPPAPSGSIKAGTGGKVTHSTTIHTRSPGLKSTAASRQAPSVFLTPSSTMFPPPAARTMRSTSPSFNTSPALGPLASKPRPSLIGRVQGVDTPQGELQLDATVNQALSQSFAPFAMLFAVSQLPDVKRQLNQVVLSRELTDGQRIFSIMNLLKGSLESTLGLNLPPLPGAYSQSANITPSSPSLYFLNASSGRTANAIKPQYSAAAAGGMDTSDGESPVQPRVKTEGERETPTRSPSGTANSNTGAQGSEGELSIVISAPKAEQSQQSSSQAQPHSIAAQSQATSDTSYASTYSSTSAASTNTSSSYAYAYTAPSYNYATSTSTAGQSSYSAPSFASYTAPSYAQTTAYPAAAYGQQYSYGQGYPTYATQGAYYSTQNTATPAGYQTGYSYPQSVSAYTTGYAYATYGTQPNTSFAYANSQPNYQTSYANPTVATSYGYSYPANYASAGQYSTVTAATATAPQGQAVNATVAPVPASMASSPAVPAESPSPSPSPSPTPPAPKDGAQAQAPPPPPPPPPAASESQSVAPPPPPPTPAPSIAPSTATESSIPAGEAAPASQTTSA